MMLASTRDGLRLAWAEKRLAVPLWLANLLLASPVAVPFAIALGGTVGRLPLADAATGELRLGVLSDLLELRPEFLSPFLLAAACAAALALLASAAMSAGTLEVLLGASEGKVVHRFGRGAGRFFGRFLLLGALAGSLAAVVAGLAVGALLFAARSPEESAWEPARLASLLGAAALALLVALPVLLAYDAARIAVVRDDSRKMRQVLWAALRQVLRHPVRWIGQWALFGALAGLALLVFWLLRTLLPAGGLGLLLVFLAQQALILVRAWLRVARFGAQASLLARLAPPAPRDPPPQAATIEETTRPDLELPAQTSPGGSAAPSGR